MDLEEQLDEHMDEKVTTERWHLRERKIHDNQGKSQDERNF